MKSDFGRGGQALQKTLLWSYRQIQNSDCMNRPWAQNSFLALYFLYKRHLEDPFARLLRGYPSLLRGGSVLDVGANIGYTALLFSKAIDSGFRVYAFEPEERNLRI